MSWIRDIVLRLLGFIFRKKKEQWTETQGNLLGAYVVRAPDPVDQLSDPVTALAESAIFLRFTYEVSGTRYYAREKIKHFAFDPRMDSLGARYPHRYSLFRVARLTLTDGAPFEVLIDLSESGARILESSAARELANGTVIKVFYDPVNPKDGSLSREKAP